MIINVYGSQGSGKTLYLVKKGKEAFDAGMQVYSNFGLKFKHKLLEFEDLKECKLFNAVVLLDEAHLWGLDARSSGSKTNKLLVKKFIVQVRKQDVTLYTATQLPRQLDVRVRENSDYIIYCKKYALKGTNLIEIVQSEHYPKAIRMIVEVNVIRSFDYKEGKTYFLANTYYDYYDTTEVIQLIEDDEKNTTKKIDKEKAA